MSEAHYERPISGSMSGSQRMAKTRARTSLFLDKEAAAREQNTGRRAELRAADRESERQSAQSSVGTIWWDLLIRMYLLNHVFLLKGSALQMRT